MKKTLIFIVILLIILAGLFFLFNKNKNESSIVNSNDIQEENSITNNIKTFAISGKNFAFDKKEIRIKKGDTVTIDFTSSGGFHDWVVDEFNAKTERVTDGQTSSVTFTANEIGSFEYYCSVGEHRAMGMVGRLIIEE